MLRQFLPRGRALVARATESQAAGRTLGWGVLGALAGLAGTAAAVSASADDKAPHASFQLEPLPYALTALEPHMSARTLEFHWGKHHRTYVDNLNKQLAGSPLAGKGLQEVVAATWNNGNPTPAFNNAAQAWNHSFFWKCMRPGGGGQPTGALAAAIARDFGSYARFKQLFKEAAASQFGSGWVWLVADQRGGLSIMKTSNSETPVASGGKVPLLTVDVWEHAYYLDYQNRRVDFVDGFFEHLAHWDYAQALYGATQSGAASRL